MFPAPSNCESLQAIAARDGRLRSRRYMAGTKISVANVANSNPPITARSSGAVLLPAFAHAQGHGDHAQDHRTRGH